MSRATWQIAGIALVLFPAGVAAQGPLTLEGAVAAARAHNASLRAARAGADAAAAASAETIATVTLATTQAFARLVAAQAARRAAAAALESAREDHARAARRRDAGMLTDADVLALAVHVADLEQRAIQSSGDAASAEADLNRLMGAPIESRLEAA